MLAPNGQPTKLNERQWAQVRTPLFKRWFGDWEALANRSFLESEPVSTLTGDEFKADGVPLTEKVPQWYEQQGKKVINVNGIGDITLDERFVKNSISHGIGRNKSAAFAAVPAVLEKGVVLATSPSPHDDSLYGSFIAAPIMLAGNPHVAIVLVRHNPAARHAYVHEVVLTEKLQSSFKTEALSTREGARNGDAGAIRNILLQVFSVNPENVSKVIDENGEPLEVYHGTNAESFEIFDREKIGSKTVLPYDAPRGFYFAKVKKLAERYGKNVIPAFLRGETMLNNDKIVVVKDPNQIKSATSNDGTYTASGHIRHSRVSPAASKATPAEETAALALAEQAFESLPKEQQALLQRVAKQQKQAVYERNREIIEKFLAGEGILPAPNGKPSKLNLDQWLTVRTPLFKRWFGDWENAEKLKSFESGIKAAQSVLATKKDQDSGIVRNEIGGSIFFTFGPKGGTEAKNYHDGAGLEHILLARIASGETLQESSETLSKVIEAIAFGEFEQESLLPGKRPIIENQGMRVVLALDMHGEEKRWLVTGYDTNKKTTGATGKGSDSLRATELRPILGQAKLVSVVDGKLPSGNAIVNPENVSKVIDENGETMEQGGLLQTNFYTILFG